MRERYLFHVALPFQMIAYPEFVSVYEEELPDRFVALTDDEQDQLTMDQVRLALAWCYRSGCRKVSGSVGDPKLAQPMLDLGIDRDRRGQFSMDLTPSLFEPIVESQFNFLEVSDEEGERLQVYSTWDSVAVFLGSGEVADFLRAVGRDESGSPFWTA